jgi:hypothetical protein
MSTEVEDDWDCPPVLKLISFTPLQMKMLHRAYLFQLGRQELLISKTLEMMDFIGLTTSGMKKIKMNKIMSPLLGSYPYSIYVLYMTFNILMKCSLQTLSGIAKIGELPPKNISLYSYNHL